MTQIYCFVSLSFGKLLIYVWTVCWFRLFSSAGNAISFVNDRNKGICPELVEVLREANQEIPTWLEGIVRHMGAFNVLNKKAGEGNFGGQVATPKRIPWYRKTIPQGSI